MRRFDIDPNNHTAGPVAGKPDNPTFADLGVHPDIVRALSESGIERTFDIQALTLPLALRGEDVIGQARTGTGKTLGFGVPLLQRLVTPGDGTPQALVVVPTRELCLQVSQDLAEAGKYLGVRITSIYGGRPYESQIQSLRSGVDVVIGTPGRLLDLAEQRNLVLGKISTLVLDEADEMLDLGFLPDIERILRMVPEDRQTMLFSATMPGPILTLARTFLRQPTHIRAEAGETGAIHERTTQFVYRAHSLDKPELIAKVLQAEGRGLTMIFTRTKRTAQKVADDLVERGFAAAAVHGDLGQGAREQALRAFRSGKVDILVATDVAARGIDVEGVTHVINYQMPEDEKTYVHRIGRTGRAGRTGVAITLVDWDEVPRWKLISDELGLDMPEPVETYSTSKHLFTDLGIPEDATGRLPLSKRTRAGLAAEDEEDFGDRRRRGRTGVSGRRPRRQRRRTRGGREITSTTTRKESVERSDDATTGTDTTDATDEAGPATDPPRPRRRRTRGGSHPPTADLTAPPEKAESTSGDGGERPARRRRRRRRVVAAGPANTVDTAARAD
ncbi:MAG TPA: DEAD/DEAH box helicase [Actinopolymorphaceae bacterium]|jgi:superfamily II DNA/RNA helicase|uniref:RNA helicase n=2 Tax=Saccharomonospora viridis TaxID=1852 RepID=C7MVL7_SACVD|nr:DEAD/DEAH box helicase [Saccharomonospora viridis]ACU95736.1 DNA/RNA helicase, superfamily II [Saccharomonospora viridis DSM 43017]KHF43950.1 DEAD/DEAH box helicase [Saccharomonospora viridis]SFP89127.1 Superfamily II DNA and RNA helicase [Saccharomonospora viridis]